MKDAPKISGSYRTTSAPRPLTLARRDGGRVVLDVGAARPLVPSSYELTIVTRRKKLGVR